jgi:arsenate reductase (thioredoxin)
MVRSSIRDRNILFLCKDNACLSLIAEAIARRLRPPQVKVFSAGMQPQAIDAQTVGALLERGIDVPTNRSKGLDAIEVHDIDLIIALGDVQAPDAAFSSGTKWECWELSDPRQGAGGALEPFHRVIDEIDTRVAALFLDYWRNLA